jgi:transposase
MRANLFWLDDEQWAKIKPLIPMNRPGQKLRINRWTLTGIIHVLKTGCRWKDCPPEYGPYTTVYNRNVLAFDRGAKTVPANQQREAMHFDSSSYAVEALTRRMRNHIMRSVVVSAKKGRVCLCCARPGFFAPPAHTANRDTSGTLPCALMGNALN